METVETHVPTRKEIKKSQFMMLITNITNIKNITFFTVIHESKSAINI